MPKHQFTKELAAKINAAMEKHEGSPAAASEELGMSRMALENIIDRHKSLNARWRPGAIRIRVNGTDVYQSKELSVSDIHRPTVTPEELQTANALRSETISLRKGFASMGFKDETLDLAMALQDFHQKHFRNVIDLLGGGMVKQYLEICNEVKRITDMLVVGDLPPEQYDVLRKDRQALLEVVIRMYDRAVSAALVGAKVEFLRKHGTTGSGGGMKRAKPGFSPLKRSAAPEQDANISPPA